MTTKMIQTGYLLGLSLLVTSILYFFAANWQIFDRMTKIVLSMLLLLLFYGLHFILKKLMKHHYFLSNWLLVAASVVFGLSVALIGQVYNSHADSYELFLVWFIPVFMLACITKYAPFYVLSYILAHLTMFFFISPSSYFPEWNEGEILAMLLGIIALNALLFFMCYRSILSSKTVMYVSFIMFHCLFFYLSVNNDLPFYIVLNICYVLILTVSGYYWYARRPRRALLSITIVFAAFYVLYKVFYWVFLHYGMFILFFLLAFAGALVVLSIVLVHFLNKQKSNPFFTQLITIIITIIATFFATLAITGLFFLIFTDAAGDALFFFALFALITPGLFAKWPVQIRYTLLGTGFLMAFVTGVFTDNIFYSYLLFALLCIGIYVVEMKGIKVVIYIFTNIVGGFILAHWFELHGMYVSIFLLNVLYYFYQTKDTATKYTAFIIGYLSFASLTLLDVTLSLQIVYNLAFLITTTLLLLLLKREAHKWEWTISLVLWFLFLSYKYYEYLWSLVHKSTLALILGLIFIGIAYYVDRKSKSDEPSAHKITYHLPLLLAVVILQFGFIGYQSISSEKVLTEGEVIKLELEPVDPRSMLQGDYIILRYDINDLEENDNYNFWNKKIKVVLREEGGIYSYGGYYFMDGAWNKPYDKKPGDVIINGKAQGTSYITYGIESFFVKEGTGWDLQNEIDYAYVRVGESGNAIVEDIE